LHPVDRGGKMRWLTPLIAAVLVLTGLTAPASAAPDGTLTLASTTVSAGEPITATYSTPRPNATNWLGLYTDPATVR
ncbi:hypothetical protein, partial [Kibdelosporangium philippinense]|uniref:hypothetical protein n=1 Tax=Kibdelosporangium philippinense TaxID=211113 RepID=UPI0036194E1D